MVLTRILGYAMIGRTVFVQTNRNEVSAENLLEKLMKNIICIFLAGVNSCKSLICISVSSLSCTFIFHSKSKCKYVAGDYSCQCYADLVKCF